MEGSAPTNLKMCCGAWIISIEHQIVNTLEVSVLCYLTNGVSATPLMQLSVSTP